MYDSGWAKQVATIREYLELRLPNLQLVGRNGMHKYNNQDHSMMTALCAARNIMGAKYNLWAINSEPDYYEEQHEHKKPSLLEMEPGRPAMQSRFAFRGVALALDSDASKTSNPADI
jgi:hypothetical protein